MAGFQKPRRPAQTKTVGLAVIRYVANDEATCSCGEQITHKRTKVLEDRIDKHLARKHGGRGIRL